VTEIADKAERLRALHVPGDPLLLVNAWDAASARTVAALPGCHAVATASWSIAAAHGVPDGEALDRDAMIDALRTIASSVDLPVTADLERGYGDEPRDVAETIAMAIDAGAVGANLEDGAADADRPLAAVASHARKVRVARGRADAEGVPFVINARTDVFLRGAGGVEEALERGRAYAEAGADCIFVPGVRDPEVIAALVAGLPIGMSVLATPAGPTLDELARLGVARISLGPGPMGVALAALRRAAETVLARGELPADLAFRPGT
jgi:2-methylisocitrate lyase-like PEP mutase family enzyme